MERRALPTQPNTGRAETQLVKEHNGSCHGNNTRVLQLSQPQLFLHSIHFLGMLSPCWGDTPSPCLGRVNNVSQGTSGTFDGGFECLENVCQTGFPRTSTPRGEIQKSQRCDNPLVGINQLASVGTLFRSSASDFLQRGQGVGPHIRKTCFDSQLCWWVPSLLPQVV